MKIYGSLIIKPRDIRFKSIIIAAKIIDSLNYLQSLPLKFVETNSIKLESLIGTLLDENYIKLERIFNFASAS